MNHTNEFEEFVHLLQACLHDESLFSAVRLSKVRVERPPNKFLYFHNDYLQSRQRFILFHGDVCLILDQDSYSNITDTDSSIFPYHKLNHRLGIIQSKIVQEEYTAKTSLGTHYSEVSSPIYDRDRTILNGRACLDDPRLKYLNHRYVYRLVLDLPTNLNLLTNNTTDSKDRLQILIDLIRFNIESMRRILDGKNLRKLDSVSTHEYAINFVDQTCNLFSALNSEHNLEVRQLQNDLKNASLCMNLGQAQLSFNSCDSSWQFNLNKRFTREYISRVVSSDQFESEDHMLEIMHKISKYLQTLHLDINKCIDFLQFYK